MKPILVSLLVLIAWAPLSPAEEGFVSVTSPALEVGIDTTTGGWYLLDRSSGVRWPTEGTARAETSGAVSGPLKRVETGAEGSIRLASGDRFVEWSLVRDGRSVRIRYGVSEESTVTALEDFLAISGFEGGQVVVPCREGLLLDAGAPTAFRRTFGTSDYEGAHMNMLGFVKVGSALIVSWDDAYVFPTVAREVPGEAGAARLAARFELRRSARDLTITPLGKGSWNEIAAGYRKIAEEKGLAVTLREKIRRQPNLERLLGASNFKLWTCLSRRMNDESTREESVNVHWTFSEAARIAEHLQKDVGVDRCLFMMGGWTEGGYDCRHPDNLPANPECGGNVALADAVARIQALGYVGCLHDNYQDMYRDAKSWDPKLIEKRPDGSLIQGGQWLGGRAYMVCAPKQLELAMRPQNLPGIQALFPVESYFIDTTYAVGPRECHDPEHPLDRNDDIAWKAKLSDYTRDVFGLFGSECGREWALPHSDFFEGLVGVSGRYYHNLNPDELGGIVIPFWEMVYHDCQICYGKYGYSASSAGEYVAHHVLCARPLHYHSVPDHLYWEAAESPRDVLKLTPRIGRLEPDGERRFRVSYAWDVRERPDRDWRIFVHFAKGKDILFQDDHLPSPGTSSWKEDVEVEIGPHVVSVPAGVMEEVVQVYVGLFDPRDVSSRAPIAGSDSEHRVLVGQLRLKPAIRFEPVTTGPDPYGAYARSDGGWAEGLHSLDAFIKNTHEVLGPLHAETAHVRLEELSWVSADRKVRRARYGKGKEAVDATVHFGAADATVESPLGGEVVLPPWGFVVEGARFAAFHAKAWNGEEYPDGALFTIRSLDGKPIKSSKSLRVFHGFGSPKIRLRGELHEVPREAILQP